MASPKLSKHYMVSPPIANSARFRSPGLVRRNMPKDPGYQSAQFAKKARRSKSTDANSRSITSNMMSGKRKLSKGECSVEQHLEILNTRWRMMAKNQEKMTKEEIMNNYKLLLTDHIKLEKFMSLISRENELNRTRLESDLLDSMMTVEELKQALVARDLVRRPKLDPRSSEERRELIKQNKKLLHELHESAKKVEKLELSVFELQEQVELKDFQMMEAQNQKIIMEEQMESNSQMGLSTIDSPDEQQTIKDELDKLKQEHEEVKSQNEKILPELESLKTENDVLKISEENLQEEVGVKTQEISSLTQKMSELENQLKALSKSATNSKEHSQIADENDDEDVRTIISSMSNPAANLNNGKWEEDDSLATDSGLDNSASQASFRGRIALGDSTDVSLLQDSVKMLLGMVQEQQKLQQQQLQQAYGKSTKLSSFCDWNKTETLTKSLYQELEEATGNDSNGRKSPIGACCSSAHKLSGLEKENRRWKSFVENIGKSDNELLNVIADLEENVRTTNLELEKQKTSSASNSASNSEHSSPNKTNDKQHSAEYYYKKLNSIQSDHNKDQLRFLLGEAEKSKSEATNQILRLEEELDSCNRYVEKLDSELTAEKKMELTLRKRIDTLEQRLLNGMNNMTGSNKSVAEMETKMLQLETINSSLIEVNAVEKRRMEEQHCRIKDLESQQKSLTDQINQLQNREINQQKKINRLQGVYEDLLREYASVIKVIQFGNHGNNTGSGNEKSTGDNIIYLVQENAKLKRQLQESVSKLESMQTLLLRYQQQLYSTNSN